MMEKFNSWKRGEKNALIYKRLNSYFAEWNFKLKSFARQASERDRAGGRGRESVWCCRLRWQPISSLLECTPKSNPAATTICGLKILNCWNLKTDFSARNWSSARKTTRRRKKPASREEEEEKEREGNCRRDSARHEPVAMFAIRFGATQTEDWDSDSPLSPTVTAKLGRQRGWEPAPASLQA